MQRLRDKACGVMLSAVLAIGLCPSLALAQEGAGEDAGGGAPSLVAAQIGEMFQGQSDSGDLAAGSPQGSEEASDIALSTQASSLNKDVLNRIEGWWNTWGQRPHPPLYHFHDGVADYYTAPYAPSSQKGDYKYSSTMPIKSITRMYDKNYGANCYDIAIGSDTHFRLYDNAPNLLYNYFGPNLTHSGTSSLERLSDELLEGAAPTVTRLQGANALKTMDAIVKAGSFKKGGIVVLATNGGYWDALTAAGVAGMDNAPVLMTDGNTLSSETAGLIGRIKPKTIIICGGVLAVSKAVERQAVAAAGGNVKVHRCAGQNAVGTAIEVFKLAEGATGGSWTASKNGAFVCTSEGYWDALAAAPISYSMHMPIFLTDGANSISQATIKAMKGKVSGVYIVGGPAAISDSVVQQLKSNGIKVYTRLWGSTAIETSQSIANYFISKFKLKANNVGIATVNGYWDALSGAALCGLNRSVLLLASDANSASFRGFINSHASEINNAYIFGGTSAITQATRDSLLVWMKHGRSSIVAQKYATTQANTKRQRNVKSVEALVKYYYDTWDLPNKEKGRQGSCPVKYTSSSGVGSRLASSAKSYFKFDSVNASATGDNTVNYTAVFNSRMNYDAAYGAWNMRVHVETGTITFNDAGTITAWTYKVS